MCSVGWGRRLVQVGWTGVRSVGREAALGDGDCDVTSWILKF
jgi:hypothetical protein